MQIGVRAPMCSLTGYAEFGREIVSGLERLGVDVILELLDEGMFESSLPTLPKSVVDVVLRCRRKIPDDIPIVTIGTPSQYDVDRGSLKVGLGLFEAFLVPQPWIVAMNRMDLILTVSEFNREVFARNGLDRKKIRLIPPAVDCERFHPDAAPLYLEIVRPFTILFLGQLILRKGWDKLLIATLRTFRTHDDVCVVLKLPPIRWSGEMDLIKSKLSAVKREAGASKVPVYCNVSPVPVEMVPRVYQVARKAVPGMVYRYLDGEVPRGVFALPSLGEGIGLPYLEAQASGLLTLGTRSTGQEFLSPENAVIVRSGSPIRNLALELESTLYRGAPFPSVTIDAVSDALLRAYNLSGEDRSWIESAALSFAKEMTYEKCVECVLSSVGGNV
jgi:glycosyltransferase involved in cell wall biosynthesis